MWEFIKKYVLNIDTIMAIIIICLVIYFIWTTKKKKYIFQGLDANVQINTLSPIAKKKKKKVYKHEEACRTIFEEIFQVKFKSVRPDWLKNPVTGRNLELDGFNSGIRTKLGTGLAFEYDGAGHSVYSPNHFHKKGPDEFVYQVKKDAYKDLRCKQEGVMLIRIPSFVNFSDLDRFIKQELNRQGIMPVLGANVYQKFTSGDNIYG
jgi:hypothetical protein